MPMWPPKILISLELWQTGWHFQRQIWGFRQRPARGNWPRAIATTTDNRKWQHRCFGRQFCYFWCRVVDRCSKRLANQSYIELVIIEKPEFGVGISTVCVSVPEIIIISGFGAISIFPVVGRCCTHWPTVFSTYTWCYTLVVSLNFRCTSHSFWDISISGFGRHFRLSLIIAIAQVHFLRVGYGRMP